jgi:hypothetical protein
MKELKGLAKGERKKIHTTGIIAEDTGTRRKIILFFTGIKYSGENMRDLLNGRISTVPIKIMSDALNQNIVKGRNDVVEINCNAHGRRGFQKVEGKYIKERDMILDWISIIYKNEKECKENNYIGHQRLVFHQQHSTMAMKELKKWLDSAIC